jgi:hypothetical protein
MKMPCVLCASSLDQRTDKNKKPYFVCDFCGTQFFVRGRVGIEKLKGFQPKAKNVTAIIPAKEFKEMEEEMDSIQWYADTCLAEETWNQEDPDEDGIPVADWIRQTHQQALAMMKPFVKKSPK